MMFGERSLVAQFGEHDACIRCGDQRRRVKIIRGRMRSEAPVEKGANRARSQITLAPTAAGRARQLTEGNGLAIGDDIDGALAEDRDVAQRPRERHDLVQPLATMRKFCKLVIICMVVVVVMMIVVVVVVVVDVVIDMMGMVHFRLM